LEHACAPHRVCVAYDRLGLRRYAKTLARVLELACAAPPLLSAAGPGPRLRGLLSAMPAAGTCPKCMVLAHWSVL